MYTFYCLFVISISFLPQILMTIETFFLIINIYNVISIRRTCSESFTGIMNTAFFRTHTF